MLTWFLEADTRLFLWLNNNGPQQLDSFFVLISRVDVWIPLYALLLFLLHQKYPGKAFLWVLAGVSLMVLLTDQGSVRLFKDTFQRLRPCHAEELIDQFRLVAKRCGGKYGFISSHAANTFALAGFVGSMLGKRWWIFLGLWALVVSYSRIHLGVHYPADIAFGATFGAVIGFFIGRVFERPARATAEE